MTTLNLFRPSVGAFAVGMAQAALDATLAHTARRDAFGGKLKDLQTVAHQVADLALRTEAARLMVYAAAAAYDAGAPDVPQRAAMAKLLATETAQHVVDTAVQLHGARALQRGHLLEHLYREVRAPESTKGRARSNAPSSQRSCTRERHRADQPTRTLPAHRLLARRHRHRGTPRLPRRPDRPRRGRQDHRRHAPEQFERALANLLTALRHAGGTPDTLARVTVYATDIADYRTHARELGRIWRESAGRDYPAMAVIGTTRLWDEQALVELDGLAVLPH